MSRRYRWAPTPSGPLHVGNLFSMIHTWLECRKNNAELLLRIDDLDQTRVRKEYVDQIFDLLEILKLDWDLGPQDSEDFYKNYSQALFQNEYLSVFDEAKARVPDLFFVCECTRSQFGKGEIYPGYCREKNLNFQKDRVWRVRSDLLPLDQNILGDFIVYRKDNLFSYQWVSLLEDIKWKITNWIRGEDLLSSSLSQIALAHKLNSSGFDMFSKIGDVVCEHHPLIFHKDQKLSKSKGAEAAYSYVDNTPLLIKGFLKWRVLPECSLGSMSELKDYYLSLGKESEKREWENTQLNQLLG